MRQMGNLVRSNLYRHLHCLEPVFLAFGSNNIRSLICNFLRLSLTFFHAEIIVYVTDYFVTGRTVGRYSIHQLGVRNSRLQI